MVIKNKNYILITHDENAGKELKRRKLSAVRERETKEQDIEVSKESRRPRSSRTRGGSLQ